MTVRRNVLLIGNYPPPFGGVPNHIERLSIYLTKRGWKCHVLSGGTSGNEDVEGVSVYKPGKPRKALAEIRQALDPQFRNWLEGGDLPKAEPKFWRRYKQYADVGRAIIDRHDIDVIASYNLLTYAPVGAWLAERYALPHIISNFGEVYKFEAMATNQSFFRHVVAGSARLISCSEHCGSSLRSLGIDTPVLALPYGVETDVFTPGPGPQSLRERLGISETSQVVLFVGRLSAEMGLESFLTVAEKLSVDRTDCHFVMVGQSGDMTEESKRRASACNGAMSVVTNVPYDELPLYYRLANVVVVPTHGARTCSSLAAMEAMAVARPVVAYAIGGIPEIIHDGVTGLLVEPENTDQLASKIVRVIEEEPLRESLADAGYAFAKSHLDVDRCNQTMERELAAAISSNER